MNNVQKTRLQGMFVFGGLVVVGLILFRGIIVIISVPRTSVGEIMV